MNKLMCKIFGHKVIGVNHPYEPRVLLLCYRCGQVTDIKEIIDAN